jgi:hypothetical protein
LPHKKERVFELNPDDVPETPGLYWLHAGEIKLYVGETLNLRRRLQIQLAANGFDFWPARGSELEIRYRPLPACDDREQQSRLQANQSYWIAKWKPIGNYSELAAHEKDCA